MSVSRLLASSCLLAISSATNAAVAEYQIAFGGFAPINTDVFIADADGRNARRLAPHSDLDQNASFSRDGRWVVFTSWRGGTADLYRVHPDGSGLEQLTNDPAFDDQGVFSPDGRQLAFVSNRGGQVDLWLLELDTGRLRQITNDRDGDFRPSWSPDGRWLAFTSELGEPRRVVGFGAPAQSIEVHVIQPDGTGRRRLTSSDSLAGSPSWTADGRSILFYRAAPAEASKTLSPARNQGNGSFDIAAVDVEGGNVRVLAAGPGERWTPHELAGGRVGYASREGVEFVTGAPGERGEFRAPAWSADGRNMVFDRDVEAAGWPPHRPMHSRDRRFELVRTGIFPSWSPDGSRLAMNDAQAGALHNGIVVERADGSGRRLVYRHPEKNALAPVWSHRGERIAFAQGGFFQMIPANPRAGADLFVMNSDGSGLRQLTTAGNLAFPGWSTDDKRIVYRSFEPAGLYIVDVESKLSTLLLAGPHNFPSWSPKGDLIAFISKRDADFEVYTIRPDGSGLRRLTSSPGVDGHLAWSPDGEWIAFASDRAGFRDEAVLHPYNPQAGGDIWVMRTDGSELRQLTDDQYEEATPGWRPMARK
jgi:TolB protein